MWDYGDHFICYYFSLFYPFVLPLRLNYVLFNLLTGLVLLSFFVFDFKWYCIIYLLPLMLCILVSICPYCEALCNSWFERCHIKLLLVVVLVVVVVVTVVLMIMIIMIIIYAMMHSNGFCLNNWVYKKKHSVTLRFNIWPPNLEWAMWLSLAHNKYHFGKFKIHVELPTMKNSESKYAHDYLNHVKLRKCCS